MMHQQAQQAGQQKGPDFAAISYEQFQAIAPFLDSQISQSLEAALGPPPEGAGPPEHLEIEGLSGYRVPVDVFHPMGRESGAGEKRLPCVVYCHGGGMALGSPKSYRAILQRLANSGAVVVAPYFRNSPVARFPAGVNDCLSAVIWARANLTSLSASSVMVAGESGGGCLALTVPLLALRHGLDVTGLVDSVWADSPVCYSCDAGFPLRAEGDKDGVLDVTMRRLYSEDPRDPCAFPMNAPEEALRKLPRTAIVVYEFDPLRDEGIALYRKMLAAGHDDVDCMQLHGLTHASMIAAGLLPAFSLRQLRRLVAFAQ